MEPAGPDADARRTRRIRRSMSQGGWWGLGTMGIALPYALLTHGPHRTALILAAAAGCAMSIALGLGAAHVRAAPRFRAPIMLVYSVAHVAVTGALAIADGGADSPMAL